MGIHKGGKFLTWLKGEMEKARSDEDGVHTTRELLQRMRLSGDIRLFKRDLRGTEWSYQPVANQHIQPWVGNDQPAARRHYPLRLVASEVTTQTMIVFPQDADLFYVSVLYVGYHCHAKALFQPSCINTVVALV